MKLPLVSFLGLFLLSSVRYLENMDNWIADILSHFPFQYALAAFALSLYCLRKKMIPLAVLAGFLFILNINAIIDTGKSVQAAGYAGTTIKVYSANVHKENEDLSKLNRELQKIDPEIVLLLEVVPEHIEQIRSVMQSYQYRIENIFSGGIGFVFLSKFPIIKHDITKLSEHGNSLLEAELQINRKSVMFYGLHAQRPNERNMNSRKRQFIQLVHEINEQSIPVIVAGDFNATPYSPMFKKILNDSGLKDSREGFGWQPSWPAYLPLLWIPIDHILVSPGIQVQNRSTGSHIGSDHYPVLADLTIN